jgi:hypothetical protein
VRTAALAARLSSTAGAKSDIVTDTYEYPGSTTIPLNTQPPGACTAHTADCPPPAVSAPPSSVPDSQRADAHAWARARAPNPPKKTAVLSAHRAQAQRRQPRHAGAGAQLVHPPPPHSQPLLLPPDRHGV